MKMHFKLISYTSKSNNKNKQKRNYKCIFKSSSPSPLYPTTWSRPNKCIFKIMC